MSLVARAKPQRQTADMSIQQQVATLPQTTDESKSATVSEERTVQLLVIDGRAGTTCAVRQVIAELSDGFGGSSSYCTQGTFQDRSDFLHKETGVVVEITVAEEERGGDLE